MKKLEMAFICQENHLNVFQSKSQVLDLMLNHKGKGPASKAVCIDCCRVRVDELHVRAVRDGCFALQIYASEQLQPIWA